MPLQAHSLATATATNRELAGAAAAAAAMAEHCTRLEVSVNRVVRTCSSKIGRDGGGGGGYMYVRRECVALCSCHFCTLTDSLTVHY